MGKRPKKSKPSVPVLTGRDAFFASSPQSKKEGEKPEKPAIAKWIEKREADTKGELIHENCGGVLFDMGNGSMKCGDCRTIVEK